MVVALLSGHAMNTGMIACFLSASSSAARSLCSPRARARARRLSSPPVMQVIKERAAGLVKRCRRTVVRLGSLCLGGEGRGAGMGSRRTVVRKVVDAAGFGPTQPNARQATRRIPEETWPLRTISSPSLSVSQTVVWAYPPAGFESLPHRQPFFLNIFASSHAMRLASPSGVWSI